EGEVEEEQLLLVPVDEGGRLAGQDVGQVAVDLDPLLAAVDRAAGFIVGVEVRMSAAQEAEVLAEAAAQRVELVLLAEVPFADQPRGVAGRLEPVGDRYLGRR